jgi:hypothetical protein
MDPELIRLLQILFVVGIFVFAIARSFLRIFVKPFVPGSAPGSPENRRKTMKDFLEDLRRDLGQGEQRPARGEGLMDTEKVESIPSPATPPARRTERPAAPPVMVPGRTPSGRDPRRERPAGRPPTSAERAAAGQRIEKALVRKAAARSRPAALEETREEIETDELARAAMHSDSIGDEQPAGELLGIDLQTAFVLKEVLGPPRAYGRIRPRG